MLNFIKQKLAARRRARINRQLDRVYGEMRTTTEQAHALKRYAEQQEAETLAKLVREEQHLIAKAKKMDTTATFQSIPCRSARAW
jgi:hypothetical protein